MLFLVQPLPPVAVAAEKLKPFAGIANHHFIELPGIWTDDETFFVSISLDVINLQDFRIINWASCALSAKSPEGIFSGDRRQCQGVLLMRLV